MTRGRSSSPAPGSSHRRRSAVATFYLGGAAFGRGYGGAEVSGDNGIAGSIELRFDQALNFAYLNRYQLYGFLEYRCGLEPWLRLADGASLASAGAGNTAHLARSAPARPRACQAPDLCVARQPDRGLRVLFSVTNAIKLCPGQSRLSCT